MALRLHLDDDIVALLAALLDPDRDSDLVEAEDDTWEVARTAFHPGLAPPPDEDGFTRIPSVHGGTLSRLGPQPIEAKITLRDDPDPLPPAA
jgi:hypothetical protein